MLVLSRKVGERILIGENISVTIVRVAQGMVRVGVEAPQDLAIVRVEIKGQGKHDSGPQTVAETPAGAAVVPTRR